MTALETIRYETADRVATIRLNRPAVRNAFNADLRRELRIAVDHANADPDIRVVVLTGEGHSFSAGADLSEDLPADFLVQQQIDTEFKPLLTAIAAAPKPYISAVQGAAAGIGCALAMTCDLGIMAADAYYLQAFVNIGLIPDGGATWQLLHQLGRRRAYELIVGGAKIPAAQCLELGLVNRIAASGDVVEEGIEWATQLAAKPPLALRYAKEALSVAQQLTLADTISYEAKLQNLTVRSRDFAEGRQAFLEKRDPHFTGR